MADLHVNVVLLSTSKDRVEAIRAASKRKGFVCTVVHNDEHASAAINQNGDEGILVVDAESTQHLDQLLRSRSPNWPILVLAARFDSSAWVELFKAGAAEVIGDPLNASKVDAALDGFPSRSSPHSPVRTLWRSLARRLGLRTDS